MWVGGLLDRLTDRQLAKWTDWKICTLIDTLADSLIDTLIDRLTDWLTHSPTHRLTDSLTHRLTDWLADWLTDWLINWSHLHWSWSEVHNCIRRTTTRRKNCLNKEADKDVEKLCPSVLKTEESNSLCVLSKTPLTPRAEKIPQRYHNIAEEPRAD